MGLSECYGSFLWVFPSVVSLSVCFSAVLSRKLETGNRKPAVMSAVLASSLASPREKLTVPTSVHQHNTISNTVRLIHFTQKLQKNDDDDDNDDSQIMTPVTSRFEPQLCILILPI